ncbi:MAG: amidohydrolase family protein [Desulfobacterales bacterium]
MAVAFVDGRVVIGNDQVLEQGTVVVEDDRITSVTEGKADIPGDAHVISMANRTLLPGFIDTHVHLCFDARPDPIAGAVGEPPAITTLKAAKNAEKTLLGGVTTVRDLGGVDGIDLGLREAINTGLVAGPRMLVSGKVICMTGGHAWQIGVEVNGADEARKAAREQLKSGVDIVKLMATGGVLTSGVEPGSEQLTEAELRAGIEEAHKANRKTATHAMGTKGIINALRAGIDSIEHGVYLDDEAVSIMKELDVPLIPTISALYHIENKGTEAGIPAYIVEKVHRLKPFHLESIRLARKAGVRIAMGTDAGTPFNQHGENLGELPLLVKYGGLSVIEAIQAGTWGAAKVIGMEDELGTIEEGKLADLVVVEGNPLKDIALLTDRESFHLIMKGGSVVHGDV